MADIAQLSVVALLKTSPPNSLLRGQVGTVAEVLEPGVFEVEFSGDQGQTYASVTVRADQLVRLRDELTEHE